MSGIPKNVIGAPDDSMPLQVGCSRVQASVMARIGLHSNLIAAP